MNFIEYLAQKTAEYRVEKMNGDYSKTEHVVSQYKNKLVKLNKENVIAIQKYGLFKIYSEIFVILLIILISIFLNTLVPILFIITSFMVFRKIFGGIHLNSFNKCTIFTSSLITLLGIIAKLIVPEYFYMLLKYIIYVILGLLLEIVSKMKWFEKLLNYINKI